MLQLLQSIEPSSMFFVSILLLLVLLFQLRKSVNKRKNYPPSPSRLPVIGHLHHLRNYAENPWEGFDQLRILHGDLVRLQLGQYKFALVSSIRLMREILITKGEQFANRPHFERYNRVFGGDQENALALCNWSDLQKTRRHIAQMFIIPRYGSALHQSLDKCIFLQVDQLISELNCELSVKPHLKFTKMHLLLAIFNMFSDYLCSKKFDKSNPNFRQQAINYDIVFYDINQCYPFDFLPWLSHFAPFKKQLNDLQTVCKTLTDFVEKELVLPRHEQLKNGPIHQTSCSLTNESNVNFEDKPIVTPVLGLRKPITSNGKELPEDFVEYNLNHHYEQPDKFTWKSALFEIGDVVGGNSAVANLAMRLLGFLALNPNCQTMIVQEAKEALQFDREHVCEYVPELPTEMPSTNTITLKHRSLMPYTEACIMEVLRLTSSPIVPHAATQDTTIGGYNIDKDTYVMFNCYHLNLNEQYYKNPYQFEPMRFLVPFGDRNNNTGLKKSTENLSKENAPSSSTTENKSSENTNNTCPFSKGNNVNSWGSCVTGVQPTVRFQVQKPEHYFPFSWGKRSCLGYKMVQTIVFSLIANLVLNYEISPMNETSRAQIEKQLIPKGCLALPVGECFELNLRSRT